MNQMALRLSLAVTTFVFGLACFLYYETSSLHREVVLHARETILRENLTQMREGIKQYISDRDSPPQSLEDLVNKGYLSNVPIDPVTGQKDWQLFSDVYEYSSAREQGILDVRSVSKEISSNNTPYNTW